MARKYGRGKYGRGTYDLDAGYSEIWVPIPPQTDIWIPDVPEDDNWNTITTRPPCGGTEIWIPVTKPVLVD